MVDPEIRRRLRGARLELSVRRKEYVSRYEMAHLLTRYLGRPVHATQWYRYESGKSEPPFEVVRAVAAFCGASPTYLAFGDKTE